MMSKWLHLKGDLPTLWLLMLAYISYMGTSMWLELSYDEVPTTAHGRVYVYLPRFAWTCVCMLAFQTKNLLDTLKYGSETSKLRQASRRPTAARKAGLRSAGGLRGGE